MIAHRVSHTLIQFIDTFPALKVGGANTGDWVYVRMTDNHYSNGPVRTYFLQTIDAWRVD